MFIPKYPSCMLADLIEDSCKSEISTHCQRLGIFGIHLDDDLTRTAILARDASINLFDQTENSKLNALRPKGTYRGYIPLSEFAGDEGGAPPARYEGFVIGDSAFSDNVTIARSNDLNHANVWPADFNQQKLLMINYWSFCQSASIKIIKHLVLALGIRGIDFNCMFRYSLSNLVFMRYHADNRSALMRPKSHTDSSMITLLFFDGVPGLEISYDDKWIPLECKKNSLVCIIGDSLEALSGGRYLALRHRVRSPNDHFRHSAAFFAMPRHDYFITPCAGVESPAYFFSAGDRFAAYLNEFD
jgi:isopenicillin N synthase-like dioxygenase